MNPDVTNRIAPLQSRKAVGLSASVYDRLRELIVLGELRPNVRLSEPELANSLGVSRTPVRDALQQLRSDGLVEMTKQGWIVYEHTPREISEIYGVRAAIEAHVAWIVANDHSESTRETLVALAAGQGHGRDLRPSEMVESNQVFHKSLIVLTGNDRLCTLSDRSRDYYFNYQVANTYSPEERETSRAEHIMIVEAILDHDAIAASQLVRQHIDGALRIVLRLFGVQLESLRSTNE